MTQYEQQHCLIDLVFGWDCRARSDSTHFGLRENVPTDLPVTPNAYQAEDENYVGALVSADEDMVTLKVLLPIGRTYIESKLEQRRQIEGAKWELMPPDTPTPKAIQDKTGFTWPLKSPRKGWAYRARMILSESSTANTSNPP